MAEKQDIPWRVTCKKCKAIDVWYGLTPHDAFCISREGQHKNCGGALTIERNAIFA